VSILLTKKVPAHFAQNKNVYWNTLDKKIDKRLRNSKEAKKQDKRVGIEGHYYKHKEKIKE
jgi:low affinity Fe/Cu permease